MIPYGIFADVSGTAGTLQAVKANPTGLNSKMVPKMIEILSALQPGV